MIGSFNYNQEKNENWRSVCITANSSDAYAKYVENDAHFIDVPELKEILRDYKLKNILN